jgi:hypothetical protein
MTVGEVTDKLEELKQAQDNVRWLLKNDGLVDFHGLSYWAKRVEDLRHEIKIAI